MRTRICALVCALALMAMMLPSIAPSVSAESYGQVANIVPGNTYEFYYSTGGTRSSTLSPIYDAHWHTSLPAESYPHPNMAEAKAHADSFIWTNTDAWAEVWKTVQPTQSGSFRVELYAHVEAYVCAAFLIDCWANLIVKLKIRDISTGQTVDESFPMVNVGSTMSIPKYVNGDYVGVVSSFYGTAGHQYALTLSVKAEALCIPSPVGGSGESDCMDNNRGAWWTKIVVKPPTTTGGGGGCVLKGTEITMADGTVRPVEKVDVGMTVLGYDLETGQLVPETVLFATKERAPIMVQLNLGELVLTPCNQPIYARNGTWVGWVADPQDLEVGMELFCPLDESWMLIFSTGFIPGNFKVYDIGMTSPDNYIANGFLCDIKKK